MGIAYLMRGSPSQYPPNRRGKPVHQENYLNSKELTNPMSGSGHEPQYVKCNKGIILNILNL